MQKTAIVAIFALLVVASVAYRGDSHGHSHGHSQEHRRSKSRALTQTQTLIALETQLETLISVSRRRRLNLDQFTEGLHHILRQNSISATARFGSRFMNWFHNVVSKVESWVNDIKSWISSAEESDQALENSNNAAISTIAIVLTDAAEIYTGLYYGAFMQVIGNAI